MNQRSWRVHSVSIIMSMDTSMKSPTRSSSQPDYLQDLQLMKIQSVFHASCQEEFITGRLGNTVEEYSIVKDLSVDLLENWDTTYSATDFPPPKELNRQIPFEELDEQPLIKALVNTFKEIFPYLSIDRVAPLYKKRR
jgi:hypothetical protein